MPTTTWNASRQRRIGKLPDFSLTTNPWDKQISSAHQYYNKWDVRYKTKQLEDYYKGFQWKNKLVNTNTINYEPYTINLVYSTIKIKLASLIFQRPEFIATATPTSFWDQDSAVISAELKGDTLNTITNNPSMKFGSIMRKVCKDSFFRFGMCEVGYAADWRNPLKDDPLLRSHNDPELPLEKDRILEDNDVPKSERIYVKRIRPDRFRVAVTDEWDLDAVPWYGYFQYYYKRTLQKIPGIKWPKGEGVSSFSSNEYGTAGINESQTLEDKEFLRLIAEREIVKVWHIWDNIAKERLMLLDGHYQELWSEPFDRRCLLDLRWDEDDGFYPVPPVFQWLSPQNEINEAREQTRSFRRRFTRKFQVVKGMCDPEEQEKFTSGPDGIVVTVKQKDAITPIQNPEQGQTAENALILAKDDFNIISGTSSEARGQADRTTATQAKLIDARSQIRESAEQLDFSAYVCLVGREILLTAADKMELELWIKDTNAASAMNDPTVQQVFRTITAGDLNDGYDFSLELDITNATPQAMAAAQQAFLTFIGTLNQFPMLLHDTDLIRETAYRCGYRNERIIRKIQAAAMQQMQVQAALQGGGQPGQPGQNGNNQAKQILASQTATPEIQETMNQIQNQVQ